MGHKTRSNYALGYALTDERFNKIFGKGNSDAKSESEKEEKGKRRSGFGSVEEEAETLPSKED